MYYCKLVIIRHVPIFAIFVSVPNDEFTYWRIWTNTVACEAKYMLYHINSIKLYYMFYWSPGCEKD